MSAHKKSWVVLVIDMQPAFLKRVRPATKDYIVTSQHRVMKECHVHDIPVVIVEFMDLWPTIDPLASAAKRLRRQEKVIKPSADGFCGTTLDRKLKRLGATDLLVMGVNASACVRATVGTALDKGYRVTTGDNLIADEENMVVHRKSRDWYEKNGVWQGNQVSLAELLQQ